MRWRELGALCAAFLLAGCELVARPESEASRASVQAGSSGPAPWAVPHDSTIPEGPMGASIRRGRALMNATRDSLPRLVTSGLRCTSCHLDNGTRKDVAPLIGVVARYPQYRTRSGYVVTIEDRVNDCFVRSLNGKAPAHDSREMRDLVAYMAWLSRDVPTGRATEGQGIPRFPDTMVGDTAVGRVAFVATCARCHGEDGQGLIPPAPPLWGPRSFNKGASMARRYSAAAFIRQAMPLDRPGTLTDQEAIDIATYMTNRPHPDYPGQELDWPDGDHPVDVPYQTRGSKRARP